MGKKSVKDNFKEYKKKGDEAYRKFLKGGTIKGFSKNSGEYLDKAREFYKIARHYSYTSFQRESVDKSLNEVRNALLLFRGRLEKAFLVFFFATFILSLFFLSPVMTGKIIGDIAYNNSNNLGILFFVCSLVCLFLFLRRGK